MTHDPTDARRGSRAKALRGLLLFLFVAMPAAGALLSLVELVQQGVDGVDGLDGPSGLAVSPDGIHVYTTAEVSNSLVAFRRDVTNDGLVFLESFQDGTGGVFGMAAASAVAISPDGRHVYATGEDDDSVVVFRRDITDDALTFANVVMENVGGVIGIDQPQSVAVSSDNRHVFVAGFNSNSLAVFRRSATNDELAQVDFAQDGQDGVDTLSRPSSVAASPDSLDVYVAARVDDAISVFRRDGTPDDYALLDAVEEGVDGVVGLDAVTDLAVSPDGKHLYATSQLSNAIAVFERQGDGSLQQVEAIFDGDGGAALQGPRAVAISPEGNLVFVAATAEDAISVFHRNSGSGELRLAEVLRNGVGGINGLDAPVDLVATPDALHVYVAAFADDAVAGFRVIQILFRDGFESGDVSAWDGSNP